MSGGKSLAIRAPNRLGVLPRYSQDFACRSSESFTPAFARAIDTPLPLWSLARGVAHGNILTASTNVCPAWTPVGGVLRRLAVAFAALLESPTVGVGHEVEPVPRVRCSNARSRQYSRPDGVAASLQVYRQIVEPPVGNRVLNLLAKEYARAALGDEP